MSYFGFNLIVRCADDVKSTFPRHAYSFVPSWTECLFGFLACDVLINICRLLRPSKLTHCFLRRVPIDSSPVLALGVEGSAVDVARDRPWEVCPGSLDD